MKLICGVGVCDLKRVSYTKEYSVWNSMLNRCHNKNMADSFPAYVDCRVSDYFLVFSKFKAWYENQIGYKFGFEIDKDLLFKGNKEYHPDKCVLVPSEINTIISKKKNGKKRLPIGVFRGKGGLFEARIVIGRKLTIIGSFKTPQEAFQAYKQAKENHIKLLAEKYRDQIDPRAYEALLNYKVEITD